MKLLSTTQAIYYGKYVIVIDKRILYSKTTTSFEGNKNVYYIRSLLVEFYNTSINILVILVLKLLVFKFEYNKLNDYVLFKQFMFHKIHRKGLIY